MAQRSVLTPLLGQLHCGFLQIARKLLKLPLEPFKKRNRVGRGSGKTSHILVVVETTRLPRRVLHHVIAHGHLAIGDEHHLVVLAHAQNRGAVHRWAFLTMAHPLIIAPGESARQNRWRVAGYFGGPWRKLRNSRNSL